MRSVAVDLDAASPGELVEAASAIAHELAGRQVPGSAAVCLELAEALGRVIDVDEAALAGLVRAVDRSAEAQRWGYSGTAAWLKHRVGMRAGRAKERLTLARQLERLPLVGKLFAAGELPYGYAATISSAVTRLDDADTATAERYLLRMHEQGHSAGQVARAGERINEVVAERDGTDKPPTEARRGFNRSWIDKAKSLDGSSWVRMWLTPEDTAVFDQALEPLAKPAGAGDDRDHGQRLADALISVLSAGHRRSAVTLLIDLATLQGVDLPGRLADGTPIPAARARQIALAAGVSALVLGPGGHPLYLGRTARFASPQQRRVLETLYGTCAIEHCEIPSWLAEIHHVDGWKLGAATDIDKLAPACGFHNRWIEDNPDRVETIRDDHGRYVIRCLPPWDAGHRTGDHPVSVSGGRSGGRCRPQNGDSQPEGP
jgi:uncharacterized protein DUF222